MQGAFVRHGEVIKSLGYRFVEIRRADELDNIDGLIIPGGESTTMGKLLVKNNIMDTLRGRIIAGMPVLGTCAGMILLSNNAGMDQPLLSTMDITVERNAYGRQKESFEASFNVPALGDAPFTGVFIRAPKITGAGRDVHVLATYANLPVLVRQGNMLAANFHPELTSDTRIHEYFTGMIRGDLQGPQEYYT